MATTAMGIVTLNGTIGAFTGGTAVGGIVRFVMFAAVVFFGAVVFTMSVAGGIVWSVCQGSMVSGVTQIIFPVQVGSGVAVSVGASVAVAVGAGVAVVSTVTTQG
jgi:hypothetical protein